jgi:hypothetical protein
MNVNTRQVIPLYMGDYSHDSAQELWTKIPLVTVNRPRSIQIDTKPTKA